MSAVGGGVGARPRVAAAARGPVSLVTGLRAVTDPPRLICVGGAGSLRTADGTRVWDAPGLPEPGMADHARARQGPGLPAYRHGRALDVPCPAALVEPGERTGRYRTATDNLVVDSSGTSRITAEDFAVALVDEIENPGHVGERFTVGY